MQHLVPKMIRKSEFVAKTQFLSTFFVKAYINPEVPMGSLKKIKPRKNVSPFGPAVWPTIDNIYILSLIHI